MTRAPVRFLQPEPPTLEEVARYYRLSEQAGWFSNGGPCAGLLAERLSDHLGGAHVLPVANCTLGLIVALRAVIGEPAPGRSVVVVPSFTFTATAAAIVWAGFRPAFADVRDDCWQLDPDDLERVLDRHAGRVAGILGCSSFGTPAPTAVRDRWRAAAAHADVPLLLDSAAAFGAVDDRGRAAGALGDTEVFSFHATKPFAVGEGGAIVTADSDVLERARRLCNFGMDPGSATSDLLGINAKCSELHAATALAMLDRYPRALAQRRTSAAMLRAAIDPGVLTYQRGSEGSTWQSLQAVTADAGARTRLLGAAPQAGVQARTYFDPPLHRQPAYAGWDDGGALVVTEDLAQRSVSLPMANTLLPDQIAAIAQVVQANAALPALRLAA